MTASILVPVRLVAVVGQDFPEEHVELLLSRGVDVTGLQRAAGRTFRWSGRYLPDMVRRETLDTQLNVFASFRPKLPQSFRDMPVVLLGNIHPALQNEVLDQLDAPSTVIADTMNFWITGEPDMLARLLRRVDVLVITDRAFLKLIEDTPSIAVKVARTLAEDLRITGGICQIRLKNKAMQNHCTIYPRQRTSFG